MTSPIVLDEDQRNDAVAHLIKQGLTTDSNSAVRVMRALAKHGFTVFAPPTSAHGASAEVVLYDLDPADRELLCNVIAAKTNGIYGAGQPWPAWLQAVAESVENGAENASEIAAARTELRDALAAAELAVREVSRIHSRLAGALYDVEYAEGGDLIPHYIAEAHRAIRTAGQLNPRFDS